MPERADSSAGWMVRRGVKAVMAGALCVAGARTLIRSVRRRKAGGARVLILSYHRIAADFPSASRTGLSSLFVSTRTLVRQLEQLGRERELVSLADACRLLSEPTPRRRRARDRPYPEPYQSGSERRISGRCFASVPARLLF